VGDNAVEVQQRCLCFRFDHGHREIVSGEGANGRERLPERVGGQLDGAAHIPGKQVASGESGQVAELG
jgi:hypothetical protein